MERISLTPDEISIIANALSMEHHNTTVDDEYKKEVQTLYDRFSKIEDELS